MLGKLRLPEGRLKMAPSFPPLRIEFWKVLWSRCRTRRFLRHPQCPQRQALLEEDAKKEAARGAMSHKSRKLRMKRKLLRMEDLAQKEGPEVVPWCLRRSKKTMEDQREVLEEVPCGQRVPWDIHVPSNPFSTMSR